MFTPLPGEQADAASRGVHQYIFTRFHRVASLHEVFDGHAFEQDGRNLFVLHMLRRMQEPCCRVVPIGGTSPQNRAADVADAVPHLEFGHPRSTETRRLGTESVSRVST